MVKMTDARKLRLIALATQRFGANPTTVKAMLNDPNYGIREDMSDTMTARVLAYSANVRDGRIA